MIIKCNCQHTTQDEIHGKGNRVHNKMAGKTDGSYRCTVCGAINKHYETKPVIKGK